MDWPQMLSSHSFSSGHLGRKQLWEARASNMAWLLPANSAVFTASGGGPGQVEGFGHQLNHTRHVRLACHKATHRPLGWAGPRGSEPHQGLPGG